jgi:hypothetical protein
MSVTAEDLRRRVAGWRAAERREQTLRAHEGPLEPNAALTEAFELYDLLPADFRAVDATRARDIELIRQAWRTLRTRLIPR